MKRLLLFPFIFIYNTIKINIIKTIYIILTIIGLHFAQYYKEDIIVEKTADFVRKNDTDYTYFFLKNNNGDYSSMTTETPLKNPLNQKLL